MTRTRGDRLQVLLRAIVLIAFAGLVLFFAERHRLRWDLSRGARHSLAAETARLIDALPAAPDIKLYIPDREPERSQVAALLGACQARRAGLSWSIHDPGREPAPALAAGVREAGTAIVSAGEREERFTLPQSPRGDFLLRELDLSRVFLALARSGGVGLRVMQGPGIPPLDGPGGLAGMRAALEADGHALEPWWPLRAAGAALPADMDILLLPGPHLRLPDVVLAALERHLAGGGALFVMLDPAAEMADSSGDAGLGPLLAARGILPGAGFVVDLGEENINLGKGFEVPVVGRYSPHPVTRRFLERPAPTCFPMARALDADPQAAVPPAGLLLTSVRSFEERGPFDGNAHLDEGVDRRGPFVLAAASDSAATGGGPLLVVGDSHFVGDREIDWYGNADLLRAGVAWLGRERLRPELGLPPPPARLLMITPGGRRAYTLLALVALPLTVLVAWPLRLAWSRRRATRGAS